MLVGQGFQWKGGKERGRNVHYGKDDICLIFDRRKSDGCDHHDHEIKCLGFFPSAMFFHVHFKKFEWEECHTQFADVDNAFAGARMRKGTISAG